MPTGYVTAVAIIALYTLLILRAPRRPAALARVTFLMTHWVNEYPLIAFAALAVSTVIALAQGDLTSGGGWAVLGVAALTALGLLHAIRRASLAGEVVTRTLADQLGVLPQGDGAQEDPTPWNARRVLRDVVAPFPARPRDVRRISDIPYGDAGRRNLMDLYLRRDPPDEPRPVLIHFHGGHFQIGDRREGGDRMGTHACRGTRRRSVPDRRRGRVGGRPPRVDGALTPNHPAFQPPGAAEVDTTVAAAVCLYGYYGPRTSGEPGSSPEDYVTPEAPPFLVAAGDNDNQIDVGHADRFVERLRGISAAPVVYFRLPGAQHSFDLLRSLRFDHVVDGIVAFLEWVPRRSGRIAQRAAS